MTKNKKLSVTIGIPVYNEQANIRLLIENILCQKQKNFRLKEIIVVLDGCTDGSLWEIRKVKNSRIRIINHRKRNGQNIRLAEIFAKTKGEILILFDADTLPKDNDCLDYLVWPFLKNPKIGFVHGTALPIPVKTHSLFERIQIFSDTHKENMMHKLNGGANIYISGAIRALRRSRAKNLRIPLGVSEDSFMYMSSVQNGCLTVFSPRSVVYYKSVSNFTDYLIKSGKYKRGKKLLYTYFPKKSIEDQYKLSNSWLFSYLVLGFTRSPVLMFCYLTSLMFARFYQMFFGIRLMSNAVASSTKTLSFDKTTQHTSQGFRQKLDTDKIALFLLIFASICANIFYYFPITSKGVGFGDAWSRLNIARRVVDSLTPGIAQLGGIWLPFPQILITPFASIDPLYFSGLAPLFISSPAFIIAGWYLYRIIVKLTESRKAAFLATLLYAGNVNLLYIQTTAMSEPLFLAALTGSLYHFLVWKSDTKNILSLIVCALWSFVATLTRYEGFFLMAALSLSVIVTAYRSKKSLSYTEGMTTLFVTLAGFGIFLWFVYSWVIFGNPLNWLGIYTGKIAVISSVAEKPQETWGVSDFKYDIVSGIRSILESSLQMNGLLLGIPITLTLVALPFYLYRKKTESFTTIATILITSSPLLFYIMSSFGGSALIRNPPISMAMLIDKNFHLINEYNIRYGLMTLPLLVVIPLSVLWKKRVFRYIFTVLVIIQVGLLLTGWPTTIYNFPRRYLSLGVGSTDTEFVKWFHSHYDGGLILASAIAHDQMIYTLKLPYKNYIYEGTDLYWKQAVKEPSSIATWVIHKNGPKVTNTGGSADFVSYYLQDTPALLNHYDLVYENDKILVYKIKDGSHISVSIPRLHYQ